MKLSPDGTNSLGFLYPELAKLWHPTKNGTLNPSDVVGGGNTKHHWICPKGHEYKNAVHQIVQNRRKGGSGYGCRVCKEEVTPANSLVVNYPKVAAEWHPTKNLIISTEVRSFSNKKIWWLCGIVGHTWKTSISDRTRGGTNCPYCNKTLNQSFQELVIKFELMTIWPDILPNGIEIDKTSIKNPHSKNFWDVDMYISELNLIIEYDGYYAHKTSKKEAVDKAKSQELLSRGYNFMRIRESPLPILNPEVDITFSLSRRRGNAKYEAKQLTNNCLVKIVNLFKDQLSSVIRIKIDDYISKDDLQNEEERERYRVSKLQERKLQKGIRYLNLPPKIQYRNFERAREFAQSLQFNSMSSWKEYAREQLEASSKTTPFDIPISPDVYYKKNGKWVNWADWLGKAEKVWMPFEEAREFIRSLHLKDTWEWRDYTAGRLNHLESMPSGIPKSPSKVYKEKGWTNMADWLGNDNYRWVEPRKKAKQKSDVLKGQ